MSSAGSDNALTPGEIARTLNRLELQLADLGKKIDALSFVRQDVWVVEKQAIEAKISEVASDLAGTQENLRWLVRAVIGVVLAIVITAILKSVGS